MALEGHARSQLESREVVVVAVAVVGSGKTKALAERVPSV